MKRALTCQWHFNKRTRPCAGPCQCLHPAAPHPVAASARRQRRPAYSPGPRLARRTGSPCTPAPRQPASPPSPGPASRPGLDPRRGAARLRVRLGPGPARRARRCPHTTPATQSRGGSHSPQPPSRTVHRPRLVIKSRRRAPVRAAAPLSLYRDATSRRPAAARRGPRRRTVVANIW